MRNLLCVLFSSFALFFGVSLSLIVYRGWLVQDNARVIDVSLYSQPYVIVLGNNYSGSGVLVDYNGYKFIVTAYHVVSGNETHMLVNCDGGKLGLSTVAYTDKDRDLAILHCSLEVYEKMAHVSYAQIADLSYEQLRQLTGREAYAYGMSGIGDWNSLNKLAAFVDKVTISRVDRGCPRRDDDSVPSKESVMITVRGFMWYGCSGGPLFYDGKLIGVASFFDQYPGINRNAGIVYVYPLDTIKEWFSSIADLEKSYESTFGRR